MDVPDHQISVLCFIFLFTAHTNLKKTYKCTFYFPLVGVSLYVCV